MEEFNIAVREFKDAIDNAQRRHRRKLFYLKQRKQNLIRTKYHKWTRYHKWTNK